MRDLPPATVPIIGISLSAGALIYSLWAGFDDNIGLGLSAIFALIVSIWCAWLMWRGHI